VKKKIACIYKGDLFLSSVHINLIVDSSHNINSHRVVSSQK
jgi:hypothetical protein